MSYHSDPYVRAYDDRKMAKWLGFYLSEHTAEMEQERSSHHTHWLLKEKMSAAAISQLLERSFTQQKAVVIQLGILNAEGEASEDINGVVCGIDDGQLYLLAADGSLLKVRLALIHHVELLSSSKWSR